MATEDCPACRNVRPELCSFCGGEGTVEAVGVTHDGSKEEKPVPPPSNIATP